jgi:hypothetical protein
MRKDGYHVALTVDIDGGEFVRGSLEDGLATMNDWLAPGGRVIGFWTVEAGAVPEFLEEPMLAGYLQIKAVLALFFQRKIDARKAEEALRRRIFKH